MILDCDKKGIKLATKMVKDGCLVVFPTDTVYGLGCDPYNPKAVKSIFKLKKRKKFKHLPILAYSKNEISKIAIIDKASSKLADKFWPGQLTLVLKLKDEKLRKSMNLGDKVAVRVPDHPCALALLKECKLLAGTSANFSGQPAFSDSKKVLENFCGYDLFLDGGKIPNSVESTIAEVIDGNLRILREGKIARKEITSLL
ncbi:MAG: threonylcarbamoyl-AMP synthase [Thaumarchaeota archaeon]|nr:threonylcarbamoyl-AMP synthase [Nitrososphaerota archaeon]